MTRKKIVIISIVVLVIVGTAIAVLLIDDSYFYNPDSQPVGSEQTTNQENNQNNLSNNIPENNKGLEVSQPAVQLTQAELDVITTARTFAERYGTFSTDSQFVNLEEAALLATPSLTSEFTDLIESYSASDKFYGVSSKALKTTITEIDEAAGIAQLTVSMQRQETAGISETFTYFQKLNLSLVKLNGKWLVDEVNWQ